MQESTYVYPLIKQRQCLIITLSMLVLPIIGGVLVIRSSNIGVSHIFWLFLLLLGSISAYWFTRAGRVLVGLCIAIGAIIGLLPLTTGTEEALSIVLWIELLAGTVLPIRQYIVALGSITLSLLLVRVMVPWWSPLFQYTTAGISIVVIWAGIIGIYNMMTERILHATAQNLVQSADMQTTLAAREAELRHQHTILTQQLEEQAEVISKLQAEVATTITGADLAALTGSEVIAQLGHDLRSPLNAILNFTRFLNKDRYGTLTIRQQELQQSILENSERLLTLINDMVDLAKIDVGQLKLQIQALDIQPICSDAMQHAVRLIGDKPITLQYTASQSISWVAADETRVRQILRYLLAYVIGNTSRGIITLKITINAVVSITVKSTATRLPNSQPTTLLHGLRELSDTDRPCRIENLQLAFSRRLVVLQGGNIDVESNSDIGTRITFSLPLAARSVGYASDNEVPQLLHTQDLEQLPETVERQDINPPDRTTLLELQHLARSGDLHALLLRIAALEANHPILSRKLTGLIRNFEEQAILQVLLDELERTSTNNI